MTHCFVTVSFAAAALGALGYMGFVVRSSNPCPACIGYSRCAMWQDFRSVVSFALGALLCRRATRGRDEAATGGGAASGRELSIEKGYLYAYIF